MRHRWEAPLPWPWSCQCLASSAHLYWVSINANDHGLLASLDASLQLVVTWSAQRLQIVRIVEQRLVTLMWAHMVARRCLGHILDSQAEAAQWLSSKLGLSQSLPSGRSIKATILSSFG
ncbi:hypothetical protein FHW77_001596 [Agrobacterium sp. RC10-4-1]|nr:hypothetical protein [Agrobacterium sp. RC10-4-1]